MWPARHILSAGLRDLPAALVSSAVPMARIQMADGAPVHANEWKDGMTHDDDTIHDGDYELTEYDLADLEAVEDAGY